MLNLIAALAASAALASPVPPPPGVYSQELQRCVVLATSETDRLDFVRWMFTAMAAHPAVSGMSAVTDDMRTEANQTAASLLDRLVFKDCRPEAVNALKYDGPSSIEFAFGGVGQTAMGELMSNQLVAAQLRQLGTLVNEDKWAELAAEAGRTVP